jgi:outer membrane protein insertion porin family
LGEANSIRVFRVISSFRVFGGPAIGMMLFASAAAAQVPPAAAYVDRAISAVSIEIEGRASVDPALMEAIQTRTGDPLKMADVRETITHLYSLGGFEDVRVEAEAGAGGGVSLRYVLSPIHTVTKVLFRGGLGLDEGSLRGRMIERFGETPPLSRAADVAAALEELYRERGYLSGSVRVAAPIIEHNPDRATLVLELQAGARTTIARSTVTGRPLEPESSIQSRLQIQPGRPYQPGDLQARLADYVTSMRRRHHYEAAATVQPPVFNEDRTRADVTVDVQPGPLVTIQFTGDPLPKDKIAELVPIEREGSVDQDLLEDSARRITEYLNQQGYWKAEVTPPERTEADGRLTLVFNVNRGRLYRIAPGGIEVTGNQTIGIDVLRPLLKLPQGDVFVSSTLGAITGAIAQLYKTRGFATVQVDSATNEVGDGLVKPVIVVKEGPLVLVGRVTLTGNQAIATDRLTPLLTLKVGDPYFGPAVARDRDALLVTYLNAGYSTAEVTVPPVVPMTTPEGARADVVFKIVEGPQTIVEHIFITGNLHTKPAVIQRELQIKTGSALGLEDLTESRRRLSALGLFRRIQISAISHGDSALRDVIVNVEEAPQTTIGGGGGLELDRRRRLTGADATASEVYEFAPRGFFEIGRRNIGGRDRSANLYTRLSLRPNSDPSDRDLFGFEEFRVVGTYREPRALGSYGDLVATAAVEQGVRTGFNFSRKGLTAELTHRFGPTVRGSGRYSFNTTRIFDPDETQTELFQLTVDRVFPQVRLSTFSAGILRDTRDDLLDPQRGTLLAADGALAARAIGSEVGFMKTFLQGFVYKNLGRPHLVLAGGARLGLAQAFLQVVDSVDANGNPIKVEVRDLPASERFFAGGATTVRGFALDTVGVPETISPAGFPTGGDAEIVLNLELRAPVRGPLGVVLFADGGNVFVRATDMSLAQLRGSLGLGARVTSPLGPIRFDVGFKLDRRTLGTKLEPRYAFHFSIGQAF